MLVCSVSARARLRWSVDLIESAAASDDLTTVSAVFDALVDDPASANDIVDAYFGEIMIEAASAADTIDAGFLSANTVTETATATDTPTASIAAGVSTIWNSGDSTNITLSNGNLTAAASANAQASVRATVSKSTSGKYYFEVTGSGSSQNSAVGISTASPGGSTLVPTQSIFVNWANAVVFLGGSTFGTMNGPVASGDVVGIAIDLTNQRAWFRRNNTFWNNDTLANPATNTNGFDISAYFASAAAFPIVTFTGTGLSHTANFGPTFAFGAPSGFGNWG